MSIIYENEDILRDVPVLENFIPDTVLSCTEASLYVIEAITKDYNEMMESIGIEELAVYESTGMEIVYEAEAKESLFSKITGFIQKAWARIKAWFEDRLKDAQALIKKAKEKIFKLTPQDVARIKDDKKLGKMHTYDKLTMCSTEYFKNIKKAVNEIADAADNGGTKISETLIKTVTGKDIYNIADMKKFVAEECTGEEIEVTKKVLESRYKELVTNVVENGMIKLIKEQYKNSRQIIDMSLNACKRDLKNVANVNTEKINLQVAGIKELINLTTALNGVLLDVAKKRHSEYRNVLVKAMLACDKAPKAEKTETKGPDYDQKVGDVKESAAYAEQMDLIEAAFNF